MKSNQFVWRLILTVILISVATFVSNLSRSSDTLVQGQLAAAQTKPSDVNYITQAVATPGWSSLVIPIATIAVFCLWIPMIWRGFFNCAGTCSLFLIGGLLMTGCGLKPPRLDKYVQVGPNETVFVIPLQGDNVSSQGKFNSAEYLNGKKVQSKQILIPQMEKKTGRFDYEIDWIDAVRVIKVNRAMVSREWSPPDKGTSQKDESIPVVTKDSIQLGVGVAVTAFIEEDDAATYLYYHGELELAKVMDTNVRNWCVAELTKEYGTMDLVQAQTNFPAIFARVFLEAKTFFKTKGITIQQFGNAEGYEFKNQKIQDSINATFIAEQDNKTASQEKLAQDVRNGKLLASAQTERQAAEELFKAKEAATMKNQLEIQLMQAKANLQMAEKWNGALPSNILPANSPMLLNLNAK